MKIKVKHILAGLIIVILAIVGLTIIYKKNYSSIDIIESEFNETENDKIKLEQYEDSHVLILELVKKNGDWARLPITEKFRNKYNEKEGILGNIEFDKVEYRPYRDGEYYFTEFPYFVITQGKTRTAYIFNWDTSFEGIDDIAWAYTVQLTDKNGNKLDERQIVTEENFNSLMRDIAFGPPDDKGVGVTPHFHKKYPYFLDLFIHYSPLPYNHIEFVEEKSSWEKKEAYFIVDSTLECKKRYYLVEFILDDRGYLDDAIVHKVNEEEYEGDSKNIPNKIIFKNSSWNNLNLSENFKKKHNSQNGVFPNIDDLNLNSIIDGRSLYNNLKDYIYSFEFKNGIKVFYHTIFLYDEDSKLEDIKFEKLPYTNMSIDEVKKLYLKDHPQE